MAHPTTPRSLRLREMPQTRRRLVFARRHQVTVGAQHVIFPGDLDVIVVLAAIDLAPEWLRLGLAGISLGCGPRTRERIVDDSDLVANAIGVRLVDIDAFLDDG